VNILKKYVDAFRNDRDLDGAEAEIFLDALVSETDEQLLSELFIAWNSKDVTSDEIYEIARIMRERCTRVATTHEKFIDIVGTGGSRSKTFNVSTAAAFVIAGAGIPVAKHGNKAATSNSGSADVLSALGVEPAVDASTAERCLNDIGICFMFAPNFHRLSATLAKVRRGLGFPTIFNCVGPLCNPANAPHRLIGVWDKSLVPKMADALARLGTEKSWIVYGDDGLDEISLNAPTFVAEVDGGSVQTFEISPTDVGLKATKLNGIRIESADESAALIRSVLGGKLSESAAEHLVTLNAAAALFIAGGAKSLVEGFELAAESLRSGRAAMKLKELAEAVKK